jgi:hypothetical protein
MGLFHGRIMSPHFFVDLVLYAILPQVPPNNSNNNQDEPTHAARKTFAPL